MSIIDIDDDDQLWGDDRWLDKVRSLSHSQRSELLVTSAGEGELWRCERLVEMGADIAWNGYSPLFSAATHGRASVIDFLLQKPGTPKDAMDAALRGAANAGKPDALRALLAKGADARADQSSGLWHTVVNGDVKSTEILLQGGADVNAHNGALMAVGLSHRHGDVALVLLRHGADPSKEHLGRNAFEWAGQMHMEDVFRQMRDWVKGNEFIGPQFFEGKTADELRAAIPGRDGRTGLHLAAQAGAFDVAAAKLTAITATDLLHRPNENSPSVLDLLGQTGQLKEAFSAALWEGRKQEMLDVFAKVPELYRDQVDIRQAASTVDQLALKRQQKRFSLKP